MNKTGKATIEKGLYIQGFTVKPENCIEQNGMLYDVLTIDIEQPKIVNQVLKYALKELIWKLDHDVINESKFIQEVKDMVNFEVAA